MNKIFLTLILGVLFFPSAIFAASISLSPSSSTTSVGDKLTMKVLVSGDQSLNAVSGTIAFPTNLFSVESVSKTGSILNFWVKEPSFSKSTGIVSFEGVSLSGFTGSNGNVLSITLRALSEGSGVASFKTAQILANDGQGTNITGSKSSANMTVIKKVEAPLTDKIEKEVDIDESPADEVEIEDVQNNSFVFLNPPSIESGEKYGVPAILGTSEYNGSQVLISFIAEGGVKVFIATNIDDEGKFFAFVPSSLKRGTYTVAANVVRDDGVSSTASDDLIVNIGPFAKDFSWGKEEFKIGLIFVIILSFLFLIFKKRKEGPTLVN